MWGVPHLKTRSSGVGRPALIFRRDPRRGPEKLSPCRLIGVRGRNTDEGFMGARRSTGTDSARWFLFPTPYLGATASDLGSVGESEH